MVNARQKELERLARGTINRLADETGLVRVRVSTELARTILIQYPAVDIEDNLFIPAGKYSTQAKQIMTGVHEVYLQKVD